MQVREHRQVATIEEVKAEAEKIWKKVLAEPAAEGAAAKDAGDALHARLQEEHENFARSFPVVLRWMAQLRKYNSKAFGRFLKYHAAAKVDTEDDFLALQAEYPVQVFVEDPERKRRHDRDAVSKYRAELIKQLRKERDDFEAAVMEVQSEQKAEEARLRSELLARLRAGASAGAGAGAGAGSEA